jgi:preprotein translocase subunit SecG
VLVFALYAIHIVVCVVLIMVVLLQSGKAADLAGAFGGGGSQTALGSRGAATVLSKATTICAVIFMLSSLALALVGSRRGGSVLENVKLPGPSAPASESAPAAPTAGGAPQGSAAPGAATSAPAAGSPGSAAPATPSQMAPAGKTAPAAPAKPPGSPK